MRGKKCLVLVCRGLLRIARNDGTIKIINNR